MKNLLTTLLVIAIGIPLFIVFSPIILISVPFFWYKNKRDEKAFFEYLDKIDGKNFFCYNNRRKSLEFIENTLLPQLPSNIEVIYLDGKKIKSFGYNDYFISMAFYGFKNYSRFPQLLKIRNGETVDCSINNELFQVINQGKNEQILFNKMSSFFES